MKTSLKILITVLAFFSLSLTHKPANLTPDTKVEVVQTVTGYSARCWGENSLGYTYWGYAYGYSTRGGAISRARSECAAAGGIYNQRWDSWYNY